MKPLLLNKILQKINLVLLLLALTLSPVLAQNKLSLNLIREIQVNVDANYNVFNFKDPENPGPKIEVYDNKVIFYNELGIEIITKQYTQPFSIIPSKNQKYIQIIRTTEAPKTKTAVGISTIELYSQDGTFLWSKTRKVAWEGSFSKFIVSDEGNSIEVQAGGQLIFYDRTGNMVNQHEIYKNLNLELTAFTAKFSDDGEYLLLGVNFPFQPAKPKEREKNTNTNRRRESDNSDVNKINANPAVIILFDKAGNKQWQFIPKHSRVMRMFFSPNNKYVLFSAQDRKFENSTTYVIKTNSGQIISEYPGVLAISAKFFNHHETEYALINSVSQSVSLIDLANGNRNDLFTVSGRDENILGTAVTSENGLIVFARTRILWTAHNGRKYPSYQESSLVFYNLNGNLLSEQSVPGEYLEALDTDTMDKMFFTKENTQLVVYSSMQKSYRVYEINLD